MADITREERLRLLDLTAKGFKTYADKYGDRRHVGTLTDSEGENRLLISRCGTEFADILAGRSDFGDFPLLSSDLFKLIERGCPLLDIIDLMFSCTKGRTLTISDRLDSIGLRESSLHILRDICQLASQTILALNGSTAGPLSFLSQSLPELSEEDRERVAHDLRRLPDLIGLYGDLLAIYPPPQVRGVSDNVVLRHCEPVLFYMLLNHFSFGYPTLSRLLRAMRRARSLAAPTAKYLRKVSPNTVVLSEQSKSKARSRVRDPFGEMALQKRLNRFYRENGTWNFILQFWLLRYLSDEFSEQRASGIFFTLLPQVTKPTC